MTRVHEGMENVPFEQPADIVKVAVCRKSGKLPSRGCQYDRRGSAIYEEYFDVNNVPTEVCDHHTSGGSMILPEGEESKRTDDSSYGSNYRSSGGGSSSSSSRGSGSSQSASQGGTAETVPAPAETQAPVETAAPEPEPQQPVDNGPSDTPGVIYQGGNNQAQEIGPGV